MDVKSLQGEDIQKEEHQNEESQKLQKLQKLQKYQESQKTPKISKFLEYAEAYKQRPLNIVIAGIIGVGKTELTKQFATITGWYAVHEPVKNNPVLEAFYSDMKANSFLLQAFFLNERYELHQRMIWADKPSVQDRCVWEDPIFALMLFKAGLMSKVEFNVYQKMFANMTRGLARPHLIIYLDVTPQVALDRIALRGRECEKSITLEYLTSLRAGYEDWLDDMKQYIPILRIDWSEFQTVDSIMDQIPSTLKKSIMC